MINSIDLWPKGGRIGAPGGFAMRNSTAISCPECAAAVVVGPEVKPRAIATCARCGLRIALVAFQESPALFGTASIAGTVDDREVTLVPTEAGDYPVAERAAAAGVPGLADGKAERYRFHYTLGEGGMGCVFLCTDRDLRRQIALKQMLPGALADPLRRVRFVEEAQVTGQLEHPNIVPVYELGKDSSGNGYYTMEWVRGRSLKRILAAMKAGNEEHSLGELMEIFDLVDHRSDIYSLGALLYEILTLGPPVHAGKHLAALSGVREGEMVPPEKRAPRRIRSPDNRGLPHTAAAEPAEKNPPANHAKRREKKEPVGRAYLHAESLSRHTAPVAVPPSGGLGSPSKLRPKVPRGNAAPRHYASLPTRRALPL